MTRPLLPQDQPQLMALGLRLAQARERRAISAALMAERIGVPLEALHRLEAGDASLDIATLYRALRILGLSDDFDFLAQDAPLSVVDLLANKKQSDEEWLQSPGQHSFNDEMNGISVGERKRMDADKLGYKEYKCPNCGWVFLEQKCQSA